MKYLILVLLVFTTLSAFSETPCVLPIGTNLAGPSDYGSEWPFVNIMKYSRQWITFNSEWVSGGVNPWDTGVLDVIPMDEHGYPLELPLHIAGTETTQVVRTVWANTEALPEGRYIVLYDGEGRLGFSFDMRLVSSTPGRCEVDLTFKDNIAALEIRESKPDNHVRNIRVLLPGTESTYAENPWCDVWLEKLEPFQSLRFMDWGRTNNSKLTSWEDRPQVDDFTYTIAGIPYEWMIEICNYKQADAWVCVPHLADENYIRQMARLFRDLLDPSLTIYVEYSNEVWNWMFEQTHYCNDTGDQSTPWPERIAPFIQNVMDIWSDEFDGQMHRIVRVVGVQHAWQDVSNRIVKTMRPGSFDAFSPAAYIGFTDEGINALEALGRSATAEDVLFWAHDGMLKHSWEWSTNQFNSIAKKYDIPMIYYEAGQHLTPSPFGSDQPYNQALMDAQTHPAMYDLYSEWFDSLRTLVLDGKPSLMMNFSFIGPKSGKYGSWGALESQFYQDAPYRETAPKFQALLDYQCEVVASVQAEKNIPTDFKLGNYPNPFNPTTTIQFTAHQSGPTVLTVFDARGRRLFKRSFEVNQGESIRAQLDFSHYPSGVYLYTIQMPNGIQQTRKMMLLK